MARGKGQGGFHPLSWGLWLLGALVPALVARNPFYVVLMLIASSLVYLVTSRDSPLGSSWSLLLKTGLALAVFGAAINPLTVHIGEHVLFTLPSMQLGFGRVKVLELGGRITLEALSYGVVNGLRLTLVLLIFAAFNLGVDHYRMLRAIPFHHMGVVLSIAFTFVPQMVLNLKRIREAQTIRGHRFRSLRDLVPLVVPLLVSALEKAVQLAESMEARGFSYVSNASPRPSGVARHIVLALGLLALLGGLAGQSMLAGRRFAGCDLRWMAIAALLMGAGLLFISLRALTRGHARTRYRGERWHRGDTVLAMASGIVLGVFFAAWLARDKTLWFYPYPSLSIPGVNPWLALLSALIAAPALLRVLRECGVMSGGVHPEIR